MSEKKAVKNQVNILNWILEGLKRYHANGNTIRTPDGVRDATDEYRQKSDKIQNFIDECLNPDPQAVVKAKYVYEAFGKWCKLNGYGIENKTNFFDELRAKGLLFDSGTINGITARNVVKGYTIDDQIFDTQGE